MYFVYGDTETEYLSGKDKKLCAVITQLGHIYRECDDDLFACIVHNIVGQQISSKALKTVWGRVIEALGDINADTIDAASAETLQSCGMTFRKAEYIKDLARKVKNGEIDLDALYDMPDDAVIKELVKLKGIGVWTAEMLMLFCMQRPNVLSFDDLAIIRGMRMVYRHRNIDRSLFEKYRRRLSPYCSVASLYFWAVAGGALPGLTDPATRKKG